MIFQAIVFPFEAHRTVKPPAQPLCDRLPSGTPASDNQTSGSIPKRFFDPILRTNQRICGSLRIQHRSILCPAFFVCIVQRKRLHQDLPEWQKNMSSFCLQNPPEYRIIDFKITKANFNHVYHDKIKCMEVLWIRIFKNTWR
jgi:hypothetical protein